MSKKTKISWAGVEADLKKYCQDVLASAASKISYELTKETQSAIEAFYNDYNPIYYRRHYYNFYNKSFRRYYINSHGKSFRGGVEFTPELMDDLYQDNTQEVFDTVYAGFHGPAGMFEASNSFTIIRRMTPSPMERIRAKREEIKSNIQTYIDYGRKQASHNHYSHIEVR